MGLFKKDDDATPPTDPPVDDLGTPEPKYVTEEAFNKVSEQLDGMVKTLEGFQSGAAYRPPDTPAALAAPVEDLHKASKERITQIDVELKDLAGKADDAVYQGKGVGDLMTRQNQLYAERGELQGQILTQTSDPRLDAGIQTLDALSTEITSGKMPHLAIAEIKGRYDHYIGQLAPEQRMNPEAKMGAYNLAVGENQKKIDELNKQVWLREAEEAATQDPPGGPGSRTPGTPGGPPTPEQVLSPEALKTIKGSRQQTPDNYYRSLGYEGWDDYYEKNKEYLAEEEEN